MRRNSYLSEKRAFFIQDEKECGGGVPPHDQDCLPHEPEVIMEPDAELCFHAGAAQNPTVSGLAEGQDLHGAEYVYPNMVEGKSDKEMFCFTLSSSSDAAEEP